MISRECSSSSLLACDPHAPQRHVVAAPLAEHGRELVGDHGLEERHILVEDLLLQRDRVRADDHALVVLDDAADRGHEVCEALADARPRLDEEPPARIEVLLDRVRHTELLRPRLKRTNAPRERTLCSQEIGRHQRHARESSGEWPREARCGRESDGVRCGGRLPKGCGGAGASTRLRMVAPGVGGA